VESHSRHRQEAGLVSVVQQIQESSAVNVENHSHRQSGLVNVAQQIPENSAVIVEKDVNKE